MKQPVIIAWDDLYLAEGQKVEATEERILELNGHRVTLDLTAEHAKELDDSAAPWLAAGTTVSKPRSRPKSDGVTPQSSGAENRGFYQSLRDWADSQGRTREYTTPGGTWHYQKKLKADYAAHLESVADAG